MRRLRALVFDYIRALGIFAFAYLAALGAFSLYEGHADLPGQNVIIGCLVGGVIGAWLNEKIRKELYDEELPDDPETA